MTTAVDQEAIRVANRYASLIEKATTLTARARACETAAQMYRADARANQESAEDHRQTARTIRDRALAHQHATAARDAEAEAAREILAARMYEVQAEAYVAQAHGAGGPAGGGTTRAALDAPHRTPGHYDGAGGRSLPSATTGDRKDVMTVSPGTTGPAAGDALPDTAGLTQTADHWHGSEILTPTAGGGSVSLGRCRYHDSGAYVVVATNPTGHRWEPDSTANGIDPALSPREAGRFADTLDELAGLAESGTPAKAPTKLEKVAARVRELLGDSGVTIAGDDGEIEVSAADMRRILDAAVPEPAVATRRKVDAKDCKKDGMDTGAVWAELDTSGPEPTIAVTSTEGETPEEYPEGYTTTRLTPAEARQLADTMRRFSADPADADQPDSAADSPGSAADSPDPVVEQVRAAYHRLADRPEDHVPLTALRDALPDLDREQVDQALLTLADHGARLEPEALRHRVGDREQQAALHLGGDDRHYLSLKPATGQPSAPAAPARPAPGPAAAAPVPDGPRRVTNPRGKTFEYDPADGSTAVIEPDGWRAVVPASCPTGVAARLLVWREEIKQGRGQDATTDGARAMLAAMTAAELREVADEIGTTAPAARTKAQLTDAIVNSAIASPLKHRGLAKGWW